MRQPSDEGLQILLCPRADAGDAVQQAGAAGAGRCECVQMAIMRVQKALIDDEISEKTAGLLLYSLQMASSNLKHTTFTDSKKEVVTEMPVSPTAPGSKNLTTG